MRWRHGGRRRRRGDLWHVQDAWRGRERPGGRFEVKLGARGSTWMASGAPGLLPQRNAGVRAPKERGERK
jgi:hypothetical protein